MKSYLPPPDFFRPALPDGTVYHVGVSGGKDSTAVLLYMVHESGVPHHQIDVTFCDTGNEHQHTLDQIKLLNDTVFPVKTLLPELGFFDLVRKKGIFPTNSRRYCTEHLKIRPAMQYITGLLAAAPKVVSVSGVRADESDKRKDLLEWDYSGALMTLQWRPLIWWTLADVLSIHERYNVRLNPLYGLGAERVGCFPCIYSRKREVRLASQIAPDKIDMIRQVEEEVGAAKGNPVSFFHANTVPPRFRSKTFSQRDGSQCMIASIDDVVRWSLTGHRAKGSYLSNPSEPITCVSGHCE